MHEEKTIRLAKVRGMCSGVRRALGEVEALLQSNSPPGETVYVCHEIVHNRFIVEALKKRGVVFVDDLAEVPPGSTLVFSAHGVGRAVEEEAQARQLRIVDASCPLVKALHRRAAEAGEQGAAVILIGHAGHPEVEGILGRATGEIHRVADECEIDALPAFPPARAVLLLCQTTLNPDRVAALRARLREKIPRLADGGGICYATGERQQAVRALAAAVDLVLVVGSARSSNSTRLRETAEAAGTPALLIDRAADLSASALRGIRRIGLTAGASAPDELLDELVRYLERQGFTLLPESEEK